MIDSLLVWRCISELDIWLHNGVGEFFGTYWWYFGIMAWEEDIWAGILGQRGENGSIWMDQRNIWDMFASNTVVGFLAWHSS